MEYNPRVYNTVNFSCLQSNRVSTLVNIQLISYKVYRFVARSS